MWGVLSRALASTSHCPNADCGHMVIESGPLGFVLFLEYQRAANIKVASPCPCCLVIVQSLCANRTMRPFEDRFLSSFSCLELTAGVYAD